MVEDTRVCCEMIKSGDVVCAYYYCYNYTTNEKLIFSNEKKAISLRWVNPKKKIF